MGNSGNPLKTLPFTSSNVSRLRDGRSIHTVSALLLQLVQTSAHDVRIKVKRLAINRQESFVMRPDSNSQEASTNEAFLTERDHEVYFYFFYF